MMQSHLESWIEAVLNTAIGFFISYGLWYPVAFLHGIETNHVQNLSITACFTAASLIRSYVIRRWCQAYLRAVVKKLTLFLQPLFRIKETNHNG